MAQRKILVCVTGQKNCERLIQAGAELALGDDAQVTVVHVLDKGASVLGNPKESEALEYLFRTAKQYGAEMTMLRAQDVMDTLVAFAKEQEVNTLVLGVGADRGGNTFADTLRMRLPEVHIHTVFQQA